MGATGWEDLAVVADAEDPARFTASLDARWMLVVVPQGGAVAMLAARAMAAHLGDPSQSLRSLSVVFAGQVACGPVEIRVREVRRGRSMSQLAATVRNPGAPAGLEALAVFGTTRPGFEFTELAFPEVPGPEGLRSYRDPIPDEVAFTFDRPPMPFWEEIIECRPSDTIVEDTGLDVDHLGSRVVDAGQADLLVEPCLQLRVAHLEQREQSADAVELGSDLLGGDRCGRRLPSGGDAR